jgi:hypothetical protein
MSRLADECLTPAAVSQFKRGKSSLVNATIDRDFPPPGALPLTSAFTMLKCGPVEQLTILRGGTTLFPSSLRSARLLRM